MAARQDAESNGVPPSPAPSFAPPSSSFVGRRHELDRLIALLDDAEARIITLTGPGGVGKTRLVQEAVARLGGERPIAAVSLNELLDPKRLPEMIARALGVVPDDRVTTVDTIVEHVGGGAALLVLDGCEPIVDGVGAVIDLLAASPGVAVLATSRRALGLAGERVLNIEPLAVPELVDETGRAVDPHLHRDLDVVRLFLDRADAARPGTELSDQLAAPVAAICRRTDGLPLAVEIFAEQCRHYSLWTLAERLDEQFTVSCPNRDGVPSRHRTLRVNVEHSVEWLSEPQRRLWQRLAVCEGGFTIELAEALAEVPPIAVPIRGPGSGSDARPIPRPITVPTADDHAAPPAQATAELIDALVGHGLLYAVVGQPGESRFAMLATTRAVAREQLAASGDEAAASEMRSAWVHRLAIDISNATGPHYSRPDRVGADFANVRAALRWDADNGRTERALDTLGQLSEFWTGSRETLDEGSELARRLLAAATDDVPDRIVGWAHLAMATFAHWTNDLEAAREAAERAVELGARGDESLFAEASQILGSALYDGFQFEQAARVVETAYERGRAGGRRTGLGPLGATMTMVVAALGDYEAALRWGRATLQSEVGRGPARVLPESEIGWAALLHGDDREAATWFTTVLSHRLHTTPSYSGLYNVRRIQVVFGVGVLAVRRGQHDLGVRLMAAAERAVETDGTPLRPPVRQRWDDLGASLRAEVGASRFQGAWMEGVNIDWAAAIELATEIAAEIRDTQALSSRERDVLALLVEGASDQEIAERLFITRRTASKHVAAILDKLDAPNRTAAVAIAHRRRMI